jgi:cold shock CspA family protein/enamine deaminase RidA (YjgF/YER057c/UK114 family)
MTTTKRDFDQVLADLGLKLPDPCKAAGNYRPAVLVGDFLYVSGHTQDDARHISGCAVGKVAGSFKSQVSNPTTAQDPNFRTGAVKWFNPEKGYGFLKPDDGGKDVFVHITQVELSGISPKIFTEGTRVSFVLLEERGKIQATGIKLLKSDEAPPAAKVPAGTVTPQQAYDAARDIGLAILASVKDALGGDLNRVKRLVRATGVVNAHESFTEHPQVMNGFSDLMAKVFGEENGVGARSATGVPSLPGGVAVEVIEAIFEVKPLRKTRTKTK